MTVLNPTDLLLQAFLSFVATLGFSVFFNVPRKALLACSLIGMMAHLMRLWLEHRGVAGDVATFFGSLFVGLVGSLPAWWLRIPPIVFAITGIVALIPGIAAYEILVYFSQGDILGGLKSAVKAGFGVGAIAAGIGTARILTDREWGMEKEG